MPLPVGRFYCLSKASKTSSRPLLGRFQSRAEHSHFGVYVDALCSATPLVVTRRRLDENTEAPPPAPLRLHLDYQLEGAPAAVAARVQGELMPRARAVLQRALRARAPVPPGEALLLPPRCGGFWQMPGGETPCASVTPPAQTSCGEAVHNEVRKMGLSVTANLGCAAPLSQV